MRLFLIGMMGSGKSYWGRQLHKQLKIDFFDLDECIEKELCMPISEIFSTKGEAYFRDYESEKLKTFNRYHSFILATGGGTPCFHENMEWMNAHGITVWLNETANILAERLKKEKAHRPLVASLSDNVLQDFLERKIAERTPFYGKAKLILEGSAICLEQLLQAAQTGG